MNKNIVPITIKGQERQVAAYGNLPDKTQWVRFEASGVWEGPIPAALSQYASVQKMMNPHPAEPTLVPEVKDALVYINPDKSIMVTTRKMVPLNEACNELAAEEQLNNMLTSVAENFGLTYDQFSSGSYNIPSCQDDVAINDYLMGKVGMKTVKTAMSDVSVALESGEVATCNLCDVTKLEGHSNGAEYRCEIGVTSFDAIPAHDGDVCRILKAFGYESVSHAVTKGFHKFRQDYANMTGMVGVVYVEFNREEQTMQALMPLNTLCGICGYFYNINTAPGGEAHCNINNGYNCHHPDCSEVEEGVGCCHTFSCPISYEADGLVCKRCGNNCVDCGDEECSCDDDYVVATIRKQDFNASCMCAVPEPKDENQ